MGIGGIGMSLMYAVKMFVVYGMLLPMGIAANGIIIIWLIKLWKGEI